MDPTALIWTWVMLSKLVLTPLEPPCVCLGDRVRFPDQEAACQAKILNREHQDWLLWQVKLYPGRSEWEESLRENKHLYQCWDWLHAAQGGEGRDEEYWLYSLGRVRDLTGTRAYFGGDMPPPVPVWRLRRIE